MQVGKKEATVFEGGWKWVSKEKEEVGVFGNYQHF